MSSISPVQVKQFYQQHFAELRPYEQFHFASRLWLWCNDDFALAKLRQIKTILPSSAISAVKFASDYFVNPSTPNYTGQRLYYFQKYPQIREHGSYFFRKLFLADVLRFEHSNQLFLPSPDEVHHLVQIIKTDQQVINTLSTFALNYLFLSNYLFFDNKLEFDRDKALSNSQNYLDQSDNGSLQNFIYFFTHMVIGECLFYTHQIEEENLRLYRSWFGRVEKIIKKNLSNLHLDSKLEFLACSNLLQTSTDLYQPIQDEASKSSSGEGDFIIDMHNDFPQHHRVDFCSSEHRNVLYLMANQKYLYPNLSIAIPG